QPVAAYVHDYDRRFFSGEEVHRRVEVFNDLQEASKLELRWSLRQAATMVDEGVQNLELQPAGHRMLDVVLRMPQVAQRTSLVWQLSVRRNGKDVFTDKHTYAV